MRTLAVTADPTEWLASLWSKLQPWVLAAGVMLGTTNAPAMDTLGLASGPRFIAQLASNDVPTTTSEFSLSPQERFELYRTAQAEAGIAQIVLQELRSHIELPEAKAYLDAIDEVLEATPDVTSLEQTQAFTMGLQGARVQLLRTTASLQLWLRIAHAVAPEEAHDVPERFMARAAEKPADEPLVFNSASMKARRLVRSFLGDDANSQTGRS
jgi:hypothetical protein